MIKRMKEAHQGLLEKEGHCHHPIKVHQVEKWAQPRPILVLIYRLAHLLLLPHLSQVYIPSYFILGYTNILPVLVLQLAARTCCLMPNLLWWPNRILCWLRPMRNWMLRMLLKLPPTPHLLHLIHCSAHQTVSANLIDFLLIHSHLLHLA